MTAKKLGPVNNGNRGNQVLYQLDPPLAGHPLVVASAVSNRFGVETYIFPADADGNITDWSELPGSYKGGMDHDTALQNAGYEVTA